MRTGGCAPSPPIAGWPWPPRATSPCASMRTGSAADPAGAVVQAFRRAVKEAGGDDGVDMMRGWGDVEFVATDHRVPTIYFGPGTVAGAHTADEYIDLDR